MRTVIGLAVSLLTLVCFAAPTAAAPLPQQDSVTGRGSSPLCGEVVVDARSGPGGERPTGEFACGGYLVLGPVSCLSVSGNIALLTVEPRGEYLLPVALRITDNGPAGDRLEFSPGPGGCPTAFTSYTDMNLSGDLTVVDALPFPTAKAQCKSAGWKTFGSRFKNQGQCVAFVERGPKS